VSPQRFTSPKKIQNTIFLDEEGILRIEYMVKGTTINGKVYLKLKEALKLKRPSSWRQKNLLLPDNNCKVHKACNIQAVIRECGFTELRHPSYGLDLAPCEFFLFKKLLKKFEQNIYHL
jgi:histone-lysine N-methyltransferase SETMAR